MRLVSPRQLRRSGVVGINARNCRYVADVNSRPRMLMVNDKIRTKELANAAGIPVPDLYGVIKIQAHTGQFEQVLEGREEFVVKPALGAQGDGIIVIGGRIRGGWRRAGGARMTDRELDFHLSNVLSGMYSLNGLTDVAMLEARVNFASVFDKVSYKGVPDIRILVYKGVPTMAMVRLPSRQSDGKANLHKGGVGVGVDLARGVTTTAVQYDRVIDEHPDTGHAVSDIELPGWREMMMMAGRSYEQTQLGYLGVDIVIDRERGPLLLELNARPGLTVQLANFSGLQPRLDAVDRESEGLRDPAARVDFAMSDLNRL